MPLSKIEISKKNGNELFKSKDGNLAFDLLSFWQWSNSDLVGNTLRGVLAEYIVSTDIECPYEIREEWDPYDLESKDGIKVEVKSGSYLQSWKQENFSTIQFDIKPTKAWDSSTGKSSEETKRQADVYVFCVLNHKDKSTVDPLNMQQWQFYVVSTKTINKVCQMQGKITLSSLLKKLNPRKCIYGEIHQAIREVV